MPSERCQTVQNDSRLGTPRHGTEGGKTAVRRHLAACLATQQQANQATGGSASAIVRLFHFRGSDPAIVE